MTDADHEIIGSLKACLDSLPVAEWEYDRRSHAFTRLSASSGTFLGAPVSEWLAPGFIDVMLRPEDAERIKTGSGGAKTGCEDHVFECRTFPVQGVIRCVRVLCLAEPDCSRDVARGWMLEATDSSGFDEARPSGASPCPHALLALLLGADPASARERGKQHDIETRTFHDGMRVMLFSSEPEADLVRIAERCGADGYICKDAPPSVLLERVVQAVGGS